MESLRDGKFRIALDNDNPADVIDATNSHDGEIDSARGDYVEETPADTPEPDPGWVPGGPGDDNLPPAA